MRQFAKTVLAILTILILVTPSQASYKNNCVLTGSIVSEVSSSEMADQVSSKLDFQLAVTAVKKYGRADSGCEQFINTKTDVEVYQDLNNPIFPSLTKGSQVKVIRFESDMETTETNDKRLPHYQLF